MITSGVFQPVPNDEEFKQFIILHNKCSGWHVVKHPVSLPSIVKKTSF